MNDISLRKMTENDVFIMATFARSCILCFLFESPETESFNNIFVNQNCDLVVTMNNDSKPLKFCRGNCLKIFLFNLV